MLLPRSLENGNSSPGEELSKFATCPTGGTFGGSQLVGVPPPLLPCSQHRETSVVPQALPKTQLLLSKERTGQHAIDKLGILHKPPPAITKAKVSA